MLVRCLAPTEGVARMGEGLTHNHQQLSIVVGSVHAQHTLTCSRNLTISDRSFGGVSRLSPYLACAALTCVVNTQRAAAAAAWVSIRQRHGEMGGLCCSSGFGSRTACRTTHAAVLLLKLAALLHNIITTTINHPTPALR